MVFITCGLGGGTGSGAGPIVAEVARELGALTVAIVTKPFCFEGPKRCEIAERAWEELVKNVDTIITIPNDRIMQVIDKKTTMLDAFRIADEVLRHGVQGISELITIPGLINVDFADVKTIMKDTGSALMGIGTGTGENRAVQAANAAISSPLLELSIDGAHGILFTIAGGQDLTMEEVSEAAKVITSSAANDAKIIFGAIIDENLAGSMRITVVATGFDERHASTPHLDVESTAQNLFSGASKMSSGSFARKIQKEEAEEEKKFKQIIQQKSSSAPSPTSASNFFSARPMTGESIFNGGGRNIRQITPSNQPGQSSQLDQSSNNSKNSSDKDNEDDLEIPAFIRRKMGI